MSLTPISQLGEFGLIERLTANFPHRQPSTVLGVGDDAAILDHRTHLTLISTDLLIEGVHFDLTYAPLKHLGYKSVVVNLSDIYAMNGTPQQILVSLALSSRFTVEAIEELYDGIRTACKLYQVDLVGGDTSASQRGLFISVTAIGSGEAGSIVQRGGAQPDDLICVSGDLGAAYLGLQVLEREKQVFLENPTMNPQLDEYAYFVERQLKPEARRDVIAQLKALQLVPTAMMDISDGLSSELLHICRQSRTGCIIFEENIPLHADATALAMQFNLSPVTCALNGGEDYELLFTVKKEALPQIEQMPNVRVIGKILPAEQGKTFVARDGNRYELIAQGWNALRKPS